MTDKKGKKGCLGILIIGGILLLYGILKEPVYRAIDPTGYKEWKGDKKNKKEQERLQLERVNPEKKKIKHIEMKPCETSLKIVENRALQLRVELCEDSTLNILNFSGIDGNSAFLSESEYYAASDGIIQFIHDLKTGTFTRKIYRKRQSGKSAAGESQNETTGFIINKHSQTLGEALSVIGIDSAQYYQSLYKYWSAKKSTEIKIYRYEIGENFGELIKPYELLETLKSKQSDSL